MYKYMSSNKYNQDVRDISSLETGTVTSLSSKLAHALNRKLTG